MLKIHVDVITTGIIIKIIIKRRRRVVYRDGVSLFIEQHSIVVQTPFSLTIRNYGILTGVAVSKLTLPNNVILPQKAKNANYLY
jgi:hypothetical protein